MQEVTPFLFTAVLTSVPAFRHILDKPGGDRTSRRGVSGAVCRVPIRRCHVL